MMRLLPLALFLTLQCPSPAQAPRMTVRDPDGAVKLLRLEQAEVSVRFLGDVAETVFDLNFRNDGPRAVEGEFALRLPDGATVSGYALEVNGSMRDGVSVEKERARTAYETVKRRMIDPGIVERESGNVYRTKVYPVPANGTKRLRIRYNESLRADSKSLVYSLPLDFPEALGSFSCHLTGDGIRVADPAGLGFADDGFGSLKAELKASKPGGTLKVSLDAPGGDVMILENEAQPAFMLSAQPPDLAPRARPAPQSVILVWDASASGRQRDHAKEFALLDAWFAKLGKAHVKLRLLRNEVEDAGGFDIRGGAWSKLKQALQQVDYDGASALSRLRIPKGEADLVVWVVGDGISTLGAGFPSIGPPWVLVHSGTQSQAKSLVGQARASSGTVIDLAVENAKSALGKLTHQPWRLIGVTGGDLDSYVIEPSSDPGKPLRVFGTLKDRRAGSLELRYGFGDEVTTSRQVSYQPGGNPSGIVRRLLAQRVLADLEQQECPDAKRIIEHSKRNGLVSGFTSLIVLERIEDYAEHQIVPPEKELRSQYDDLVAKLNARGATDPGGLAAEWAAKLAWYGQRFPGYEALILPRLRQVGIWKQAVEKQFEPSQRDPEAFATVAGWFDKVSGLIAAKPNLRTAADYQSWRTAMDDLLVQGPKLKDTPLHAPPAGQALGVSVRGLVKNPGVIAEPRPMTLRQAIEKAGGLHASGALDNVALYRNGGKLVYNTLSDQYQDVPLFPADMLVVGSSQSNEYSGVDPFSASPQSPPDHSKEAPIREQVDVWTVERDSDGFPTYADATPPGNGESADAPRRIGEDTHAEGMDFPDPAEFEKILAGAKDPAGIYRKSRGERLRSPRFYIEAARMLFAMKHDVLARRVLSNLCELRSGDVSAHRAYAFWLAEFGQATEAEAILSGISGDGRMEILVNMDLASLRGQRGDVAAAVSGWNLLLNDLGEARAGALAAISVTEFNALRMQSGKAGAVSPQAGYGGNYQKYLPADIRIVVTSADEANPLRFEVTEPGGFRCSFGASLSPYGGRVTASSGVAEYMIRNAVPGAYQIAYASEIPTTVRAVIHTDWGRPNQKSKVVTLLLDRGKKVSAGEVVFEFRVPEK